ncbi:MAG: LSM domain-containing protein [Candidatus Asgardarchaeia archaeon]
MSIEQPINLLRKSMNKQVIVKLKNEHEFKGNLVEVDAYMNLVLVNAEEIQEDGSVVSRYERIFIRGNNILFIKPSE